MTRRGPSKVNAFDEGNEIMKKSIVNRSFFFTTKSKLTEGIEDVKRFKVIPAKLILLLAIYINISYDMTVYDALYISIAIILVQNKM